MRFDTGDIEAVIAAIEDDRMLDDVLAACADDAADTRASTEPEAFEVCFARGSIAPNDEDLEPLPREAGVAVDGFVEPALIGDDECELASEPSVIVDPGYYAPRSRSQTKREPTERD